MLGSHYGVAIARQPGRGLLVAYIGGGCAHVVRLHANGSLDEDQFHRVSVIPGSLDTAAVVNSGTMLTVLPDGKFLLTIPYGESSKIWLERWLEDGSARESRDIVAAQTGPTTSSIWRQCSGSGWQRPSLQQTEARSVFMPTQQPVCAPESPTRQRRPGLRFFTLGRIFLVSAAADFSEHLRTRI